MELRVELPRRRGCLTLSWSSRLSGVMGYPSNRSRHRSLGRRLTADWASVAAPLSPADARAAPSTSGNRLGSPGNDARVARAALTPLKWIPQ